MARDGGEDFLAGFLVGAIVGAVAALLLAPLSGEETRSMIRERSLELRDKAELSAAAARRRAEELAHEAARRGEELEERGRIVLQEQGGKVQEIIEKGKKAASRLTKSEEEAPGPAQTEA